MVKVIVGLLVIGAIVLGVVYFKGGVRSFDPGAQGRQAKAAVKTGMTWQQVVDSAGPPLKFSIKWKEKKSGGGLQLAVVKDGPQQRFDRALFENTMAKGLPPEGFRFIYYFTAQEAFSVHFDSAGLVEEIADDKTVADLLDSRK